MKLTIINHLTRIAMTFVLLFVLAATYVAPAQLSAHAQTSGVASDFNSDFNEVALQGFGDRANSEAWSMAWFNGHLFVGTARNLGCFKDAMGYLAGQRPYPPSDKDILCPGNPPTLSALPPTLGAQVWSLPLPANGPITQSDWTLAYQSPLTNTFKMQGQRVAGPPAMGFRGMGIFNDGQHAPTLYLSGVSLRGIQGPSAPPPPLVGTTDGHTFAQVPADPGTVMGDINRDGHRCCLRDSLEYNGKFYVAITGMSGAGDVFAASSPQDGDNAFQQMTPITPITMSTEAMAVFNGHLYVGGGSPQGYRVWRTDAQCAQLPCPYSAFTPVVPPGGGLTTNPNTAILSMQVFTDTLGVAHLYVGGDGAPTNSTAELIRINADDSWDLIAGTPRTVNGVLIHPLSQLPAGFGWPYNFHLWRMGVDDGTLYVGTFDASTAFKDTPAGPLVQNKMGFDLYASRDGITFSKVTDNGFGDMFNMGARTMMDTPSGLFIGTNNVYYGLRIYAGSLSQSLESLAPQQVIATRVSSNSVALTWTAPPNAVKYTVYRSTLAKQTVSSMPPVDAGLLVGDGTTSGPMLGPDVWTQSDDTALATTTIPYFDDTTAISGTRYFYDVVAQSAQGATSERSNSVAAEDADAPGGALSFNAMRASLDAAAAASQQSVATQWDRTLATAQTQLQTGNVSASLVQLDSLGQQLHAAIQAQPAQSSLAAAAMTLEHLRRLVLLVQYGALSAAQVDQ